MSLTLDDPAVEKSARELAATTGEPIDLAVRKAVEERLDRIRPATPARPGLASLLLEIGARCAALPDLDKRAPDEILGYDEQGLPR